MIDTHCHLTHPRLRAEVDEIVVRARAAGITACLTIGTGVDDARDAAQLTRRFPDFVAASAGIDPFSAHALGAKFDEELAALGELLTGGEFRALGEIGLDYHHALDPAPVQIERFESQLELAAGLGLPVVIHVREAHEDMLSVLSRHPELRGVIHSFTAGTALAERYLDLGWHLAFNGVITFPRSDEVREAARLVPPERLLVETDSPFLAPRPHRGRRCEPAHVVHTLRALAELRGASESDLAALTTRNAQALLFRAR